MFTLPLFHEMKTTLKTQENIYLMRVVTTLHLPQASSLFRERKKFPVSAMWHHASPASDSPIHYRQSHHRKTVYDGLGA